MKRFITLLLCLSVLLGITTCMSGCSDSSSANITKGEWISRLNENFGMESYAETTPYFTNVSETSKYYEDTQIAYEWDVFCGYDQYDPSDIATKEFAIVTLINAGEFCDTSLSNEEKIDCAVQNGFVTDDVMLKIQLNKPLTANDADGLLATIQEAWAEKTFDHVIEDIDFFDTIKDYSNKETTPIKDFQINGDKTYIPMSAEIEIAEGDIYVLPINDKNIAISSYKAKKVETENGYIVITNDTSSVDFEEIVQTLKVEETYKPDLLAGGIAYDGNGNVISLSTGNQTNHYPITTLGYQNAANHIEFLGKGGSGSIGFKKGDWDVSGKITSSGVSFTVNKKINDKLKAFFSVSIDNIEVTNDIDFSWGKLHSATSKVDYNVNVSGGVEGEIYKNEYVLAPWHSNEVNQFLKNMKTAFYGGWKDKNSPGTATINICSIPIASAGIVTLNLDIKVKLTVEGTFELDVTLDGSKGVQYKNKNVRWIKTNNVDVNVKANAKAEATPSLGLNAKVLGKAVIGVAVDGGLGMQIEAVLHLIDTENHLIDTDASSVPADIIEASVKNGGTTTVEEIQKIAESQGGTYKAVTAGEIKLDVDLCFNVKIYPVLKIGLEEDTVAGKLLKGLNIKLSYEFFGSDDAFLNLHIENFSDLTSWNRLKACNNKECSKEFTPFDNVEDLKKDEERQEEKEEYNGQGTGILDKEQLDISTYAISIDVDEKKTIEVTKIPKGYQLSEITCYSENDTIAAIDKDGTVKGVDSGSTTIVVETIDKKFKITCAVTVKAKETTNITPLSIDIVSDWVGSVKEI